LAPHSEIHFERVAITPEQVERYNLPTRPTKSSDSRSKKFGKRSIELDALPPDVLVDIARNCILRHVDENAYTRTREIETQERETLKWFFEGWGDLNIDRDYPSIH
jgi:hypothetical protein